MLKKLYLLLPLATLLTLSGTYSPHKNYCSYDIPNVKIIEDRINQIGSCLNRINRESKSILYEFIDTIMTSTETNIPNNRYEPLDTQLTSIANAIVASEELEDLLFQATSYFIDCIVNHGIRFNNLPDLPEDLDILTQKFEDKLDNIYFLLDEETKRLLNNIVVAKIDQLFCTKLIEGLCLEKHKLEQELEQLTYDRDIALGIEPFAEKTWLLP